MFPQHRESARSPFARSHGIFHHGDRSRAEIAITFDDGPHPHDTPQVLEALARHNVRATFFLLGQSAEQYPQLVKRIYESGHQPALHGYRHIPFPWENASTLNRQLYQSRTAIANACGISPASIRHVRPPYGFYTSKTLSLLKTWGYRLTLWDTMPLHFLQPLQWTIVQLLKRAAPGSIIVLHDGKGHGEKAAQIVNAVIPQLKAKGFEFVTIEQMQKPANQNNAA